MRPVRLRVGLIDIEQVDRYEPGKVLDAYAALTRTIPPSTGGNRVGGIVAWSAGGRPT